MPKCWALKGFSYAPLLVDSGGGLFLRVPFVYGICWVCILSLAFGRGNSVVWTIAFLLWVAGLLEIKPGLDPTESM